MYSTSTLFDFIISIVRERLYVELCSVQCRTVYSSGPCVCKNVCKNKGVYKQKTLNILGPDFELFTLRTLTILDKVFLLPLSPSAGKLCVKRRMQNT